MIGPENPPAFPPSITCTAAGDVYHGYDGMTLRDWFAGQALPGYVQHLGAQNIHAGNYIAECATEAYAFADAMLAARGDTAKALPVTSREMDR